MKRTTINSFYICFLQFAKYFILDFRLSFHFILFRFIPFPSCRFAVLPFAWPKTTKIKFETARSTIICNRSKCLVCVLGSISALSSSWCSLEYFAFLAILYSNQKRGEKSELKNCIQPNFDWTPLTQTKPSVNLYPFFSFFSIWSAWGFQMDLGTELQ